MNTAIIHPQDDSTTFLDPIYRSASNKTVVKANTTIDGIKDLIQSHDRIIMLGHGCPWGLFNMGMAANMGIAYNLVINYSHVELLRNQYQNIYIWCNADQFVEKNDLFGFYSGMFISEVAEARHCNLYVTQEEVDESNHAFAEILGKHINLQANEIKRNVQQEYGLLNNVVARYNSARLYYR